MEFLALEHVGEWKYGRRHFGPDRGQRGKVGNESALHAADSLLFSPQPLFAEAKLVIRKLESPEEKIQFTQAQQQPSGLPSVSKLEN